jgi:hypothetical protein
MDVKLDFNTISYIINLFLAGSLLAGSHFVGSYLA